MDDLEAMNPSKVLFYRDAKHEPLDAEGRAWLVEQLIQYPERVHPERTCSIGWITDQAVHEFVWGETQRAADRARIEALEGAVAAAHEVSAEQLGIRKRLEADLEVHLEAITRLGLIIQRLRRHHGVRVAGDEPECPYSEDGRHHVDTSMESGPNNCFHCERPM